MSKPTIDTLVPLNYHQRDTQRIKILEEKNSKLEDRIEVTERKYELLERKIHKLEQASENFCLSQESAVISESQSINTTGDLVIIFPSVYHLSLCPVLQ